MADVVYAADKNATVRLLGRQRFSPRKAVAFDVAPGELQFFRSVLIALLRKRSDVDVFFFYRYAGPVIAPLRIDGYDERITHVEHAPETFHLYVDLDIYITTEQFISGPPTVYTVTLFHGQPAKGLTFKLFDHDPVAANDGLFLYGPLQRKVLDEHLALTGTTLPSHLSLFDVGYTKSDRLLAGVFNRNDMLTELGLDPEKKTIIYAPAFNDGASMRENGIEIVEILSAMKNYNILAKLAIDCLDPELVGGINWYETIAALEKEHSNFRLVRDLEIDRSLAASDVLVTCVSSVGYEFLALRRPVIFVDVPVFYNKTLPSYFPDWDVSGWAARDAVNGGRAFGPVVDQPQDLPVAIEDVFEHIEKYPFKKDELPRSLLYNPGNATEVAVEHIEALIDAGARSSHRPSPRSRLASLYRYLRS